MRSPHLIVCLMASVSAATATADTVIPIDWDTDAAGNPLAVGQIITDQYAAFGVHVSAFNHTGPDLAITFDSANPSGSDFDLATPGYHPSNIVAMGNILIIAENAHDGDQDGLIDDPDDEGSGPAGFITFDLDFEADWMSLVLLDTEEPGSIDFFSNDALVDSIGIPSIGDNAVQTVSYFGESFNSFQVNFGGSAAIGEVQIQAVPGPGTLVAIVMLPLVSRVRRRA